MGAVCRPSYRKTSQWYSSVVLRQFDQDVIRTEAKIFFPSVKSNVASNSLDSPALSPLTQLLARSCHSGLKSMHSLHPNCGASAVSRIAAVWLRGSAVISVYDASSSWMGVLPARATEWYCLKASCTARAECVSVKPSATNAETSRILAKRRLRTPRLLLSQQY